MSRTERFTISMQRNKSKCMKNINESLIACLTMYVLMLLKCYKRVQWSIKKVINNKIFDEPGWWMKRGHECEDLCQSL